MIKAQKFLYRGVAYVIQPELDGAREWAIHPPGGPRIGATSGTAIRNRTPNAFRLAVAAAQAAIDTWLDASEAQGV